MGILSKLSHTVSVLVLCPNFICMWSICRNLKLVPRSWQWSLSLWCEALAWICSGFHLSVSLDSIWLDLPTRILLFLGQWTWYVYHVILPYPRPRLLEWLWLDLFTFICTIAMAWLDSFLDWLVLTWMWLFALSLSFAITCLLWL